MFCCLLILFIVIQNFRDNLMTFNRAQVQRNLFLWIIIQYFLFIDSKCRRKIEVISRQLRLFIAKKNMILVLLNSLFHVFNNVKCFFKLFFLEKLCEILLFFHYIFRINTILFFGRRWPTFLINNSFFVFLRSWSFFFSFREVIIKSLSLDTVPDGIWILCYISHIVVLWALLIFF